MPAVKFVVTGQYATLSHGRISAKHVQSGVWAERGDGSVVLDRVGKWMVSQTDGFSRKETVYVTVSQGGVQGLGKRMELV